MQENRKSFCLSATLLSICLRHDLGYAYGDPGNKEERLIVDRKFQIDLLDGGASEFAAKAMFDAVRFGGKEEFCLPFSWCFPIQDRSKLSL